MIIRHGEVPSVPLVEVVSSSSSASLRVVVVASHRVAPCVVQELAARFTMRRVHLGLRVTYGRQVAQLALREGVAFVHLGRGQRRGAVVGVPRQCVMVGGDHELRGVGVAVRVVRRQELGDRLSGNGRGGEELVAGF